MVRFVTEIHSGSTHSGSSTIFIIGFVKELYFSSTHKKIQKFKFPNFQNLYVFNVCRPQGFPLQSSFLFHPHVVRRIPQLVTTFTSTHSIRDNLHWLDACRPKQSCHHRRPGGVFHPLVIRRPMHHVLTHTSTHYTIDDSS